MQTYPALFSQRNLYLRYQAFPADSSADLAFAFRITGGADWERLLRCIHEVMTASPGLRTHFEVVDGQLVAVVDSQVPVLGTVTDTDVADPVPLAVASLEQSLDAGPLDPGAPSLVEVSLFVGTEAACLTLRCSHAVGDAISFVTVLDCIGRLYGAPEHHWPSILEPLRQHPGSTPTVPVLRRGKDAYATLLEPVDTFGHSALSARLEAGRLTGAHRLLRVDGSRAQCLRQSEVAQSFGAPTAFFTAYAATLQRLSGTRSVVLGVPVANRSRPAARAVGSYINTLPMPLTIDRSRTWLDVAAAVQAGTRLLMANQGLDLLGADGDLVAGRRPDRIDNSVTFYDRRFALSLPGLTTELVPVRRSLVQYPLIVTVEDRAEDGFLVDVGAASHLEAASPVDLLDEALDDLVARPSGPVVGPSVVVSEWEAPRPVTAATDGTYSDVIERIRTVAAARPDARALVDASAGATGLSYSQLVRRFDEVAAGLDDVEATCGVIMAVPKGIDAVVTVLGILASGRAYVPVDPAGPTDRLRSVLQQVAESFQTPPTVVTATGAALAGSASLSVAEVASRGRGATAQARPRSYDPHDLAYLIFTSGSTGVPKGVMIERHSIVDLLDGTDVHFRFDPASPQVWCLFHSLTFDFSVWETFGALAHGHTLVVPGPDDVANPESFVALLADHQVTVLNQTPSAFRRLRAVLIRTGVRLPQVRWVVFGGEALYPSDVSAWIDAGLGEPAFVNMYGITETTVHVTYRQMTQADLAQPQTSAIGRPLPGWGAVVVDAFGRECPDGIPGELLVTGHGLARGYLGRHDLTGERFCWLHGGDGPVRAYRSGDGVSRGADGLVYHGRIDNQVQLRGFRIELGDVAAGLEATTLVQAAVVRVVESDGREPFLAAWVVPTEAGAGVSDVRQAAARVLPAYMLPSRIVFVDSIPTTPNGKTDVAALTLPPLESGTVEAAPGTETAVQIAALWEQVIGSGPVGVRDRFMEVGGTSMHVMEIHDLLTRQLDADWLTLVDLFTHPTPQDLADYITSRRADQAESGDVSAAGTRHAAVLHTRTEQEALR